MWWEFERETCGDPPIPNLMLRPRGDHLISNFNVVAAAVDVATAVDVAAVTGAAAVARLFNVHGVPSVVDERRPTRRPFRKRM